MKIATRNKRDIAGFAAAWTGVLMLLSMPMIAAAAGNSISFGAPPWPGEKVKAEVATRILDTIGYDASVVNGSWIIMLRGVATGEIDADLGIWLPTQASQVKPMLESGKVKMVATNIADADYQIVVPQYVCDAGITSLADLHKHADKFDSTIYGIEAGNDGNQIILDMIENDTYGLSGWKMVPSSTATMLVRAKTAMQKGEWIAFLGWKPHWMNIEMDLCYPDDPKEIWGGGSTVHTIANPEFFDTHPELATFLANFVMPASVQSDWIYTYSYQDVALEKTASQWIKDHMDMVEKWLEGVQTADGRPAAKVFASEYRGG